MLAPTIFDNQV